MRQFFYQANFCAECGNALPARPASRYWRPRYFCAVCTQQRRQRSLLQRLILPLGMLFGAFGWAFVARETKPPAAFSSATVTTQTALMPASPPAATPREAEPASVFCGARTRRGTPCRRLVQPGQRCAQHRGAPSLLESKSAR